MDVNGVSGTAINGAGVSQSSVSNSLKHTQAQSESSADLRVRSEEASARRDEPYTYHGNERKALGTLRQELRATLSAFFGVKYSSSHSTYSRTADGPGVEDLAADTLGAAKRIVDEDPGRGQQSVVEIRARVRSAASSVRGLLNDNNANPIAANAIDDAEVAVDNKLGELEETASRNVESAASVLEVNTNIRQRSAIRIRTQEGDIVKLSLRHADTLAARDVAVAERDGVASSTEVAVSSSSRLKLHVKGDLNENELAAIQSVFAQAEAIADDFFDGDLGAAFNLAQGFEYDADQLSKVNMRFRSETVTNTTYAETTRGIARPVETPAVEAPVADAVAPAPVAIRHTVANTDLPIVEEREAIKPDVQAIPVSVATVEPGRIESDTPETDAPDAAAFSRFFDLLSDFLRSVGGGFEKETDTETASFQLHYSQSFKLELLKSVVQVIAPEEQLAAADNAAKVIASAQE